MKPLAEGPKVVVGSTAICGAALQSGDFALGLACVSVSYRGCCN